MLSTAILALALAAQPPAAGDWPQWRGPNRDGKAGGKNLPNGWPANGPKLAWQNLQIGVGYGCPAVVGDKLYVLGGTDNTPGSPESLRCLNVIDGQEAWAIELGTARGSFSTGWGGGPRSTPTVAGGMVYALGATGDLVCVKATDGAKVWAKNLVADFGGSIPGWGYCESVLVDGDKVVCTPGKKCGMLALNAKTGEAVWECKEFDDHAGYSSVVPAKVGDVPVYVQQTMKSAIGVRATDGKLLFKTGEIGRNIAVIPTPVVADGYAFFTAGYGAGCECYKLTADGGGVKAEKVFSKNKSLQNHHGGVVQVGDHVYGHSDSGGWTCLPFKKENPEPVWQHGKFGKGSVAFSDGLLFCYAEKGGDVAVVKATPDGWTEVGQVKLPQTSPTDKKSGAVWAHPVVANGKLYLRDFDYLFCFDLSAGA